MWIRETLYDSYGQSFLVHKVIAEEKSPYQHIQVVENKQLGKVLLLDGVVQTTEADEFFYHEMMTHVPLMSVENPSSVLIIGGGDGGILREVCKHTSINHVDLVEIDGAVIQLTKAHMPSISQGAWDDVRTHAHIADGRQFIKETPRHYDIIIVDSTDPIGVGEVLFTEAFYEDCKKKLVPKGVLTTQGGVPFFQVEELKAMNGRLRKVFSHVDFYTVAVPTYIGGCMTMGFASHEVKEKQATRAVSWATKYYTDAIHKAAFALPPYIQEHCPPLIKQG